MEAANGFQTVKDGASTLFSSKMFGDAFERILGDCHYQTITTGSCGYRQITFQRDACMHQSRHQYPSSKPSSNHHYAHDARRPRIAHYSMVHIPTCSILLSCNRPANLALKSWYINLLFLPLTYQSPSSSSPPYLPYSNSPSSRLPSTFPISQTPHPQSCL